MAHLRVIRKECEHFSGHRFLYLTVNSSTASRKSCVVSVTPKVNLNLEIQIQGHAFLKPRICKRGGFGLTLQLNANRKSYMGSPIGH